MGSPLLERETTWPLESTEILKTADDRWNIARCTYSIVKGYRVQRKNKLEQHRSQGHHSVPSRVKVCCTPRGRNVAPATHLKLDLALLP